MKKINILVLALGAMFMTAAAAKGPAIGITVAATSVDASGYEQLKTSGNKTTHSASDDVIIPSIFVEATNDSGFTLGLDYIPLSAEVGSGSNTGDDDAETSGTNRVSVNFKNHMTLYVEKTLPFANGLYLKAGVSRVTLETEDTVSTGAKYDDQNITAVTVGVGVKRDLTDNMFFKAEASYADYESATFKSRGSDAVTTVVLEDLDTTQFRLSIGRYF